MKFGHFDDVNKEYVIQNPKTPYPWINYLGTQAFFSLISNTAGGYHFYKDARLRRITRYRYNNVPVDMGGRYFYIKDNDTIWSPGWAPVKTELDSYECRHGMGYTVITGKKNGLSAEVTFFVPQDYNGEIQSVVLKNESNETKTFKLFSFVEWCLWNAQDDSTNFQRNFNTGEVEIVDSTIFHKTEYKERRNHFAFYTVNDTIDGYDTDRESFLGLYNGFENPQVVAAGKASNSVADGWSPIASHYKEITLQPGESKELIFVLGRKTSAEADEILHTYETPGKVDAEVAALKQFWHEKLNHFSVETPSEAFNNMINVWNAYQCFITFIWSRAASFIYCGLRNGYGYRDTVQDIQGIIHLDPELAAEKIRFMLSAQVDNGGGLPLVKFNHNAGHENTPDDPEYVKETGHPSYRADDALWLFPTIAKYVGESGNAAFYDEVIVYANGGEDTVYDHLKRAIQFSMERLGDHSMPAGLHADWNDCLRLGKKGESTFVAFQLYYAMTMMKKLAAERNDAVYVDYLEDAQAKLAQTLETCWDEDRFIRGIREDGVIVGAKKDPEANMWLNPQSWSVISGFASKEQADTAMQSVADILDTPYGAKLLEPPYRHHYFDGALMHIFNPDTKENGGIFSQSQGWLILAEALLGHGNAAFRYFTESSPAAMNDKAEIRVMEPYVHGQFTESSASPYAGRAHVHWLTGTASTVMVGCVEGICGMRPDADGLAIRPSIPAEWDGMKMHKVFRGKQLNIIVQNPNHVESGVCALTLNGEALQGDYVPAEKLQDTNEIVVTLGK